MEHPIFRVVRTTVCSLQPVLLSHSHGTVAQRLEQGTHNPFAYPKNTARFDHPQQNQQQSTQKWFVIQFDSNGINVPLSSSQLDSIAPLLDAWATLSPTDQDSLIHFAQSLSQAGVTK